MKKRTLNTDFIWLKWDRDKLSFDQIALLDIPCNVSIQRIRNIIYGGRSRCISKWQIELYKSFELKFLELKDVNDAIEWVAENQPPVRISKCTVRRVINDHLKNNTKKIHYNG